MGDKKTASATSQENKSHIHLPIKKSNTKRWKRPKKRTKIEKGGREIHLKKETPPATRPHQGKPAKGRTKSEMGRGSSYSAQERTPKERPPRQYSMGRNTDPDMPSRCSPQENPQRKALRDENIAPRWGPTENALAPHPNTRPSPHIICGRND